MKRLLATVLLAFCAVNLAAAPEPPSNLRLSARTWNSFTFAWNDNANDETSQVLYYSDNGEPFAPIKSYAPNTTAASLQHLNQNRTYRVFVKAKNASGESTASNTLEVFVPYPPLEAHLAWAPHSPTTDDSLTFYDRSLGGPRGWLWDFGDGTTSTLQNPTKRFTAPGAYTVKLTAKIGTESSVTTRSVVIAGGAAAVTPLFASFDCSPCDPMEGDTVVFRDRSLGNPTTWTWRYSDGGASFLRDSIYSFSAPGVYAVTLSIRRGSESASTTRSITVRARPRYASVDLPVVARVIGANASAWRSDLLLHNSGTLPVAGEAILHTSFGETRRPLTVPPGGSRYYGDVVLELFGMETASGIFRFRALDSEATSMRATSRSFTGSESSGTFGQSVEAAVAAPQLFLTGFRHDGHFRTNIGLSNSGETAARVVASIAGTAHVAIVDLPAYATQQQSIATLFPAAELSQPQLIVVESASSKVAAYASFIDSITNDPTYIAASPGGSIIQVIPSAGRVSGGNGTFWRTAVTLANPSAAGLEVHMSMSHSGASRRMVIAAGAVETIDDITEWVGGDDGVGALRIVTLSGSSPIVHSRTYTTTSEGGTYGQSVPVAVGSSSALVAGLRNDAQFRSNVGVVNMSNVRNSVTFQLRDEDGALLATVTEELDPGQQRQKRLVVLFPQAVAERRRYVVEATGVLPIVLFASTVDNVSGDPTFVAGAP